MSIGGVSLPVAVVSFGAGLPDRQARDPDAQLWDELVAQVLVDSCVGQVQLPLEDAPHKVAQHSSKTHGTEMAGAASAQPEIDTVPGAAQICAVAVTERFAHSIAVSPGAVHSDEKSEDFSSVQWQGPVVPMPRRAPRSYALNRYESLPLLVDGALVEIEIGLSQEPRDPFAANPQQGFVASVQTQSLGLLKVYVDTVAQYRLSAHADGLTAVTAALLAHVMEMDQGVRL
jgi:hypothetical protein